MKRHPTWFIQSTKKKKKGKETEGKKHISRRQGLSNASDMRGLDKQFVEGEEEMKGTREALELRGETEKSYLVL